MMTLIRILTLACLSFSVQLFAATEESKCSASFFGPAGENFEYEPATATVTAISAPEFRVKTRLYATNADSRQAVVFVSDSEELKSSDFILENPLDLESASTKPDWVYRFDAGTKVIGQGSFDLGGDEPDIGVFITTPNEDGKDHTEIKIFSLIKNKLQLVGSLDFGAIEMQSFLELAAYFREQKSGLAMIRLVDGKQEFVIGRFGLSENGPLTFEVQYQEDLGSGSDTEMGVISTLSSDGYSLVLIERRLGTLRTFDLNNMAWPHWVSNI